MNSQTRARLDLRARIIKTIAHPARLFILEELSHGSRCVRELTEMIGSDISTVSKHLSLLKNAGIIASEKKGSQVYYSLRMPCVMNFFDCVEAVIRSAAEQHAEIAACPTRKTGR